MMERRLTCINAVHFSMECEIHKVKERLNKWRKCQNTSTDVVTGWISWYHYHGLCFISGCFFPPTVIEVAAKYQIKQVLLNLPDCCFLYGYRYCFLPVFFLFHYWSVRKKWLWIVFTVKIHSYKYRQSGAFLGKSLIHIGTVYPSLEIL